MKITMSNVGSPFKRVSALPKAAFTSLSERVGRWSARGARTAACAAACLFAVCLGFAVFSGMKVHEDDVSSTARTDALAAVKVMVPKLLSYRADSIDDDFSDKYSMLTGAFRDEFKKLATKTVIPSAKERNITTEAEVSEAGIISNARGRAEALLFVNQKTTSATDDPKLDGSRVKVSLQKDGSDWKISGLRPV